MKKKPNILIILTDQQSSKMLSCAQNAFVKTSSLDNLAREGVRFTHSVCSNPVCIPSRFSLFTGQLPSKIKLRCNEDARKIPRVSKDILKNGMGFLMQKAGYKTYYGGKQHLPTFNAKDIGFDYICKDEREILAKKSAQFLQEKHNEPFILVVSFINPHDICYMAINDFKQSTTKKKKNLFAKLGIFQKKIETDNVNSILKEINSSRKPLELPPLPKNHLPQQEEPEAIRTLFKRTFRKYARENWNEIKWRQHRYIYAKLTEKVDTEIGCVLEGLNQGPHSNDTVVIFTSDHGDHDSSHQLEHKTAFYSEAVEVPFIIKWKNILPEGKEISEVINNGLDLIPTLCDIAEISPPKDLRGKSVLKIATDTESHIWTWTPLENEIGKALWNNEWAYVLYDEGKHREQLYDLKNDPGQTQNHIENHPEILEECRLEFKKNWPKIELPA